MTKEISMDNYLEIERNMYTSNVDYIIEAHKELIGKSTKDKYSNINDCGIEALRKLLKIDWGRTIVYEYSDAAYEFMKSEYLSNYIKEELKKMLSKMNYSNEELNNILNSNKNFNEMNEHEIKYLYNHLKLCLRNKEDLVGIDTKIIGCFNMLLYKLDGKGVVSLLKDDNYISKSSLASQILLTSGLNDRASYYSGRGVNYGDLSDKNLTAIFKKLIKIDSKYALNFVKMIIEMKTLGATEFINSFKELAENDFILEKTKIKNNNLSLDDVHDEARDAVSIASIISSFNREDEDYQIFQSERIKKAFLFDIKIILEEIKPELCDKLKLSNIYRRR